MQFDSYIYALFLPVVFLIYWALRNRLNAQNLFLLAASYVFYGWWDWRFLGLILITSTSTFITGMLIKPDRSLRSRLWLTLNILLNVGILFTFKYFNFFRDTFVDLMNLLGWNPDAPTINVLLPVGISFYTLQALSYTVDVYRGEVRATRNVVAFFVYIAFFPQLVAGPIERAANLLPQFLRKKEFDYYNAVIGMRQILWGLVKKSVIADNLAPFVEYLLNDPAQRTGSSIFMAGFLFLIQVYADFSGYSDIAIGSARLLNIRLLPNFRYPLFSRNFKEIWHRWHISLFTWFREYIYIPLGGSRCSKFRAWLNVMIVFTISGLWHGAAWNYVLWGVISGLFMLPSSFMRKRARSDVAALRDLPSIVFTLIFFSVSVLVFRCTGFAHIGECFSRLFSASLFSMPESKKAFYYVIPFLLVEWMGRRQEFLIMRLPFPTAVRWLIYWALLALIAFAAAGGDIQYIYFQF